ncbi:hypothetical protein [Thiolapillus sp.]
MIRRTAGRLRKAFARANRRIKSSDGLMHLLLLLRKALLYLLVVIFLIFEEVWEALHNLLVWRKHYGRMMAAINAYSRQQSRYVVLGIYLSLFVPMELLGLASAALLTSGYPVWAVLVYLSKGLIAVPAIDIFVGNKEQLLSFSLINYGYSKLQQLKQSAVYVSMLRQLGVAKRFLRIRVRQLLAWIKV